MPGIVRKYQDKHVGHASPTPNPFHQTFYAEGSSNVHVNSTGAVRVNDSTFCTDKAVVGSPNVFINNKPVHRKGDSTSGHQSWKPNSALTASGNVFANGD